MSRVMLLLASVLVTVPVAAGPIYKSVDRDGNVTYAAQPLPNAVKVEPLTAAEPPSDEQVRQAQEQAEAIASFNERLDTERKEAAKEEAQLRAAGRTIIVERPYLLPVPSGDYWWGAPVIPPGRPIRPPPPHPSPPPTPTPRPGGGMRR